jgi:hypothetical protein
MALKDEGKKSMVDVVDGGFLFSPELIEPMKEDGWDIDENFELVDAKEVELDPTTWDVVQPHTGKRLRVYAEKKEDMVEFME